MRIGSLIVDERQIRFDGAVVAANRRGDGNEPSLEFLGGSVGDETMGVAEMPQFNVGDRDVIFVGTTKNEHAGREALMHVLKPPDHGDMVQRLRFVDEPQR